MSFKWKQAQRKAFRSRLWPALVVGLVAMVGVVAGSSAPIASAAEIPGAITDVRFTADTMQDFESFRLELDWAVPDSAQPGDTFWIDLPPEVIGSASGFPFDLMSPDGLDVVATATLDPATGIVTFTLTNYVVTHDNVSGDAFFWASWNRTFVDGFQTVTINFVTNGGGFTDSIEVEGLPEGSHYGPNKWGGFVQGVGDRLQWGLESPNGPFDVVVFDDHLGDGINDPGQTIDCASVRVRDASIIPNNLGWTEYDPALWSMVCSPTDLDVTVTDVGVGRFLIVTYETVITDPLIDTYTNSVTITSDGAIDEQVAEVFRDAAGGGGAGNGRVPAISIEKWSTADGFPAGDFDSAPGKSLVTGVATPISFTITNTGNESLVNIAVSDVTDTGLALTGLNCTFPGGSSGVTWAGPWAVNGAPIPCTATLPAMPADSTHSDTASVTAAGRFSGIPVNDSDPWFGVTPPTPVPAISIEKWSTADGFPAGDFDTAPGKQLTTGVATPISFTITNTGNESLVDIEVSDVTNTGLALTGLSCTFPGGSTGTTWDGPWLVGAATITCTATLPAMPAGSTHTDTASVTAVGEVSQIVVNDSDPWSGFTPPPAPVPAISIEKWSTADGFPAGDFDTAPGKELAVGVATPISFTITNTGNESLIDIEVSDVTNAGPDLTAISCTFPGGSTGVTWAGPWAVNGPAITCVALLPAMSAGTLHSDTASVAAVGVISGVEVDANDPWFGYTLAPDLTTAPTTTIDQSPLAPTTSLRPVTGSSLPTTGGGSGLAIAAAFLMLIGAIAIAIVRTRPQS